MSLLRSTYLIWPLFKIHMLITQIVKTITLWNVLGIGHCTCCEILACPNLTIVRHSHAHYASCENHYVMECARYRPLYALWNFGLSPHSLESPYPSQWTENSSTIEAGMFHNTFYPNLAGEATIDLKFQLYFKTFWITHDKAKQIKGCQDKAFKPG